ncbi:MAG: hypothetical protein NUV47_03030 [Patescibacteria group bacterium]|nr:hypothetical protein [Patescibacteria group bacterium]
MAKYSPNKPSANVLNLAPKKRVRLAYEKWKKAFGGGVAGCSSVPSQMTKEVAEDIEMGRPVFNQ